MKDRAMQALYWLALAPIAETTADKNSYGFRPERSTADAIEQCFCLLAKRTSPQWILEGDITGCYDNINHHWILQNIPTDKVVLQRWLKAGYIEKRTLFATKSGVPQGGVISATIANMVLDDLEKKLHEYFPRSTLIQFVRYADDFIITGRSEELLKYEVKSFVSNFLQERGLNLSPQKTKITHIEQGFDFLGQNIRKYDGKLLIKPSRKSIKSFLDKVRKIVKGNKSAKQSHLIMQLNPVIKGWADYHRHVVSSKIFHKLDHEIWFILWRWAKHRHPKKGKHWIREKYFKKVQVRSCVFATKTDKWLPDGTKEWLTLRDVGHSRIQRHIKIKAEANPYDPKWESYFEKRLSLKMMNNLKSRKKLLLLWLNQSGKCSACNEHITKASGWHVHHVQPKRKGGKDNISNLVMVHPNCHRQIHSRRSTVVKPATQHLEML